jgi:ribosome-interacting GTPase 1
MPTNVTAEYKKAEEAFRSAREPRERLQCLREMLRTIPKHKGTEHLQADIKTRIKQLTEELSGPKKGGARSGPSHAVRHEGAAQVSLIGPPNSGKSSLHAQLTGSHTDIGPYPFSTKMPVPGMLPFEDVHFQLVDLPPISGDYMKPWYINALRPADAALLIVDIGDPETVDLLPSILERLDQTRVTLEEHWPRLQGDEDTASIERGPAQDTAIPDPFRVRQATLLVAYQWDLDPDPDEVKILAELLDICFPALTVSAKTGQGLEQFGSTLFRGLGVVRVYTKAPGRPVDTGRPYTVHHGQTVADVARLVHNDIARSLKSARVWGSGQFDGQQVGPDHQLADKDVIELHV